VSARSKPKLAVWKFTSCDGCQLSILNLEEELLTLAEEIEIAHFLEATRATVAGPFDISIIEGSVSTPEEAERIRQIRGASRRMIAIGACATAGGIQALRNFADVEAFVSAVYATPEYISTLATSTPTRDHVAVDFELQGCPPNPRQLLEVISAFLAERRPRISTQSVCMECKQRGNTCVMVAHGTPCLGPVTHSGCGAICPAYDRGCYGCFGPKETPNARSLSSWWKGMGVETPDVVAAYRHVTAFSEAFRLESGAHEAGVAPGPEPQARPHPNQAQRRASEGVGRGGAHGPGRTGP
jgi:coenzyme F420-reducing hydrogenase gamma subunit